MATQPAMPSQQATCLVVQHVAPERPYAISDALQRAGVGIQVCEVFAGDRLPLGLAPYSGLVVMGGPMSAGSDNGFPTRRAELALLGEAVAKGVPALGVCLGAQLLAIAAGGTVYRGQAGQEIGWGTVGFTAEARSDDLLKGLPSRLDVMHWHGDTFDLPPLSVHLASSPPYPNQAFRCGLRAWGLQFHLEVDQTAVDAFLEAFGDEARDNAVPPEQVAVAAAGVLARLAPARDLVLGRFARLVAGNAPELPPANDGRGALQTP